MTDDVYFWRGPATLCFRAEEMFRPLYESAIAPIEPPFRILGIDCDEADARVVYEHPPTGPREADGPGGIVGYSVDRGLVTEAIARLVRVYSRRVDETTASVRPPSGDWIAELRRDFSRRFDCPVECDAGWSDLIRAMAEWLSELGVQRWRVSQVKEKFGSLRAYSSGVGLSSEEGRQVWDVVAAFEAVSRFVCERCGEPGRPRRKDGCFYTACDRHV
jgi:hypothetical protein